MLKRLNDACCSLCIQTIGSYFPLCDGNSCWCTKWKDYVMIYLCIYLKALWYQTTGIRRNKGLKLSMGVSRIRTVSRVQHPWGEPGSAPYPGFSTHGVRILDFSCKISWPCWYMIYKMIRAHLFSSDRPIYFPLGLQGGRSDFDIKEWFSIAQGCLGDVPPEKLGNFVFLKLDSCNLVNTFRRKFRTGDEKNTRYISSVSRTSCYYMFIIDEHDAWS